MINLPFIGDDKLHMRMLVAQFDAGLVNVEEFLTGFARIAMFHAIQTGEQINISSYYTSKTKTLLEAAFKPSVDAAVNVDCETQEPSVSSQGKTERVVDLIQPVQHSQSQFQEIAMTGVDRTPVELEFGNSPTLVVESPVTTTIVHTTAGIDTPPLDKVYSELVVPNSLEQLNKTAEHIGVVSEHLRDVVSHAKHDPVVQIHIPATTHVVEPRPVYYSKLMPIRINRWYSRITTYHDTHGYVIHKYTSMHYPVTKTITGLKHPYYQITGYAKFVYDHGARSYLELDHNFDELINTSHVSSIY